MGAEKKVAKKMKKGGKKKVVKKGKAVAKKGGKKGGKGGKKGAAKDIKRLNTIAKAFAYGVQRDMVDLELQCTVMSAATLAEVQAIIRSLKSAEKLCATSEGRDALDWAGGADSLKDKDATMLFNELDKGKGKVNLKAFVDTCVKAVKVKKGKKVKTPKQIEDEKR